jgi:hypothetical protein
MLERLLEVLQRLRGDDAAADEARIALLEAELSHDAIRKALSDSLRAEKIAAGLSQVYCWPRDVYDDRVVYEVEAASAGNHLYQRGYSIDADGKVTLADDETEVVAQTVYQPLSESADLPALAESVAGTDLYPIDAEEAERTFSSEQRDAMAKSGVAMPDGSYPIPDRDALRRAILSWGRGGAQAAVKRHIIKRARALGATSMLPADWPGSTKKESVGAKEIVGDVIPLVEKSVRRDGTVPVKIIQPGWGSSGYYGADVLERDGPKVFTKGMKMFWDHPTPTEEAERPERSLRDMAAELTGDARYDKDGAAGPGLYADAKVFGPYKEAVEELAPHMGVSIRALGQATHGEAEGKSGPIVEALVAGKSIDFVTAPGAGGQVLQLFEAARGGRAPTLKEDPVVSEELSEAVRQRLEAQDTEIARLREAGILREAREIATGIVGRYDLPDVTKARLIESAAKNPPVKENALDGEAFTTAVEALVKDEVEYLAKAAGIGDGQVRGMGSATEAADPVKESDELKAAFGALGMSESAAALAAGGREH